MRWKRFEKAVNVLRETDTREETFAASLAHEMKTPLAALQAASASLHRNLHELIGSFRSNPDASPIVSEVAPLLEAALSGPRGAPPATGLQAQTRIAEVESRLRRAGVAEPCDQAASVVVHGGWEPELDQIEPILARQGGSTLLPLLEAVGRIRSNLRSLNVSVSRLLELVTVLRVGLGSPEVTMSVFRLRHCIDDALATLHHAVPPGAEIDVRCENGLRLSGNAMQIQQVVTNLVGNALAEIPAAGGRVLIEASRAGEDAVLRVTDNGDGVPEEIRPRLFTPFFTTKGGGRGTGLGLFISRRIVENHGGTLTFTSHPGRTCFEVRLPKGGPRPGPVPGGGA